MTKIIYIFIFLNLLFAIEPISPIPLSISINKEKANLGKELFFDPILSRDNSVSCHTCHLLNEGGDDNLRFSFGVEGAIGNINAPTVLNSVFNFVQFWDGRAKNLQEQALGPITNHVEMDNDFDSLLKKLKNSKYKDKFESIYEEGITPFSITDAIAEYEKTLITPNSPFDRYLKGDKTAISQEAKKGYEIFKNQGCIACHHGINIGGNLFAKFGVISNIKTSSLGRYEVTKNDLDKYYFKVPTLRNIELTAPYLHDGSIDNLEDVVKFMAHYQLGKSLDESDIDNIVSFLKSLTGELKDYE